MSERQTIFERFQQMPGVLQWAVYAALALVVFLVWSDHIAEHSRTFKEQADRIATDLRTVRDTAALDRQIRMHREAIQGIGAVEMPRPAPEGEIALNRAVNEVLKDFTFSNHSYDVRVRGLLRRAALPGVTGDRQAQQLSGDLRFNATPEDAVKIISRLESRPEIEAVSSVHMTRIGGRRVSVRLTVEAWVIPQEDGSRGGAI